MRKDSENKNTRFLEIDNVSRRIVEAVVSVSEVPKSSTEKKKKIQEEVMMKDVKEVILTKPFTKILLLGLIRINICNYSKKIRCIKTEIVANLGIRLISYMLKCTLDRKKLCRNSTRLQIKTWNTI